jgi:hypothetical protein
MFQTYVATLIGCHECRVDSDAYASNEACGERVIGAVSRAKHAQHSPSPFCGSPLGGDGKQPPSGAYFITVLDYCCASKAVRSMPSTAPLLFVVAHSKGTASRPLVRTPCL